MGLLSLDISEVAMARVVMRMRVGRGGVRVLMNRAVDTLFPEFSALVCAEPERVETRLPRISMTAFNVQKSLS